MSPPSDERPRRRPDASTRIPSKPLPPPALDEAEPSIFGPSGSADGPSRADLPIGIDGYSVHDVLGEGGMGRVYLGRDEDLQRPIALKTPRRAEPEHVARFIAEAQVISQLQHPGIVPIFGLGRSRDGRPYYSMPVVRGRTLQDVIADTAAGDAEAIARWSLTRLMTVFLQVCGAVGHAHAKGVLHRDLKPANIMVGQHGEVRVLDWGLANVVAAGLVTVDLAMLRSTEVGAVLGTPGYMSPEQARGESADERADVYSLGAILHELLTLRPPFEGGTEEVLGALRRGEPVPLLRASAGREIPAALAIACGKALEGSPSRRHATAAALANDVQAWLEAESDRTSHRALAGAKAAEAEALLVERARLESEISRLQALLEERSSDVEPWRPVREKRAVLEVADALEAAGTELATVSSRIISTLTEALGFDSAHPEARAMMAGYYRDRLLDAEVDGRRRDVAFFTQLAHAHDDGRLAPQLVGDGSLTLASDPPGAEAWLHEHVEEGFVLLPRHPRLLGLTPLPTMSLPMGSYLIVLKKAGHRDTRYPVLIERNTHWTGNVTLFTDDEIGAGFLHVPAGPFIHGGDPHTRAAMEPRATPSLDDFFIAEHPVTNEEYLEFLNDVAIHEGLAAARAHAPRPDGGEAGWTYLPERDGQLILPESGRADQTWLPRQPIREISWHDSVAYCAWRSLRDGRATRLPTVFEWEKAARGVDGRWFPWGNRFDPSCCNMRESFRPEELRLLTLDEMVERFPDDVSPYGVRGLGGNIRDWTASHGNTARDSRIVGGGTWCFTDLATRSALHWLPEPTTCSIELGFRLAASPRPP